MSQEAMMRQIEAVLLREYYHCVDCIDYDSEKNPSPNTTAEEWCKRTAAMIAKRLAS